MSKKKDFYDFYFDKLLTKGILPNKAHKKLYELEAAGKDITIVTQNIDGLHQAAGSKRVFELHGSVHRNYCENCHKFFDGEYMIRHRDDGVPKCDACGGDIKPDVVLYGEGLFLRHKTYKGKRGLLKNPVTVKEDDKFITNDINEIIKFILGETATFTDTNSFETLIDFVFSKNYKYDNTVIFNVLKEYLNDKRHKDKILDIISYINKAIVNWLDDSNKELYISCLTESLLKEIIFIKNYVKN